MYAFWGYGERPANALIFSALLIAVFTLLFASHGGLMKSISSPSMSSTKVVTADIVDYFLYTVGAFTTTSFPDLSFEPNDNFIKTMTTLVGIGGVTALAMFTSALGQRLGGR